MNLPPTNSVAELHYRAQLYSQGRTPQQQQQRNSITHMTHSTHATDAHATATSYAPGRSLPYSSSQAAEAAMYQLYLQHQHTLLSQHQPSSVRQANRSRSQSRGRHSSDDDRGEYAYQLRPRSRSRSPDYTDESDFDDAAHADCVSCSSSCSCSSGCSGSGSDDSLQRRRTRDNHRRPRSSTGTMTEPAVTPVRASRPSASASGNASAATTVRSNRRSDRNGLPTSAAIQSSPSTAAAAAAPAPAAQAPLRRRRRTKKPPVVWPAHSLGAYTPPVSRAVLKRKSAATPALDTPFSMPAVDRARSHIKELQSFTGVAGSAASVAASPSGSPAPKAARHSPAKHEEESKQAMEDTVVAEKTTAATEGAHDATQQKESKHKHPHSSPPAASKPTAAGQLSLSDLLNASAASSHAPTAAADPRASISSWLAAKEKAQEKKRRHAERAAAAEKAEKAAKAKESAAALERWRAKQAEMHAQREAALAKQKAQEAKLQADKDALNDARKAAAEKAYKTFLARSAARSAESSARAHLTAAQTAQAARDKKRLAKQRFDEWVARKSDWFVGRVQSIRDKQAAREAAAAEQSASGAAIMDDDDPAEEAALDWQWLEREVEQELEAASRARNPPPPPLPVLKSASASRRTAAGAAERDAALARDQALLDGVLDSVDSELWAKLLDGIECTRDELDRLRAHATIATGAQQPRLLAGEGAPVDDAAATGARRAFPTPQRRLAAPEDRAMMQRDLYGEADRPDAAAARASAPVVNVPAHASGFETVQLSQSAAHLYAQRQSALDAARAADAAAADAGADAGSRRRSSPYPTDAASVAREAQLRPGQYAGSYAALAHAKGMDDSADAAASSSASVPRSLPPAVVRSYEAWLRGELSLAMSVPPPPRMSPTRFGTVAPDNRHDVNLMHAARTTDDIIRAQNEQQFPIATAIKDSASKRRSVNTPSARR